MVRRYGRFGSEASDWYMVLIWSLLVACGVGGGVFLQQRDFEAKARTLIGTTTDNPRSFITVAAEGGTPIAVLSSDGFFYLGGTTRENCLAWMQPLSRNVNFTSRATRKNVAETILQVLHQVGKSESLDYSLSDLLFKLTVIQAAAVKQLANKVNTQPQGASNVLDLRTGLINHTTISAGTFTGTIPFSISDTLPIEPLKIKPGQLTYRDKATGEVRTVRVD